VFVAVDDIEVEVDGYMPGTAVAQPDSYSVAKDLACGGRYKS
jgi:hypothetical protein